MNEFTREVYQTSTTYREKTHIRATDVGTGQYAPYISNAPARVVSPPPLRTPGPTQKNHPALLGTTNQTDGAQNLLLIPPSEANTDPSITTELAAGSVSDDKTLALYFFEPDDDVLNGKQVDYKGANKKEQVSRFLVAYVWAYSHIFEKPLLSSDLTNAAKSAGLHDTNFSASFKPVMSQFLMNTGTGLKMKPAGHVEAKRIFDDMRNENVKGFVYWQGNTKTSKRPNRMNRDEQTEVTAWLSRSVDIGSLDVRTIKPTHQAMVSLYLLINQLKVTSAVKPRMAFEYLSKKFTTVSGSGKAFTTALSRPTNANYFGKNAEGFYYPKEEAEKEVAKLFGGLAAAVVPDEDSEAENDAEGAED